MYSGKNGLLQPEIFMRLIGSIGRGHGNECDEEVSEKEKEGKRGR